MRADNTRHIVAAAQHRHQYTRAKAVQALREAEKSGTPVTFDAVATAECHAPGFTPSRTCEPRSSDSEQPPSGHRADPCRSGNEPPMRLCCGASKQPANAAGSSPRRTAGCGTSSPGPSASNARPDPSNPANPPAVVSARQRSARGEHPPSTGRSHVENTVRTADAQARE